MSGEIKKLAEDTFKKETEQGVVLVDFYADWCGPCRMMNPVLEALSVEMKGKCVVAKLDIEKAQQVVASFEVTSIPTLILFKNGKEVGRVVGVKDADDLKKFIGTAF